MMNIQGAMLGAVDTEVTGMRYQYKRAAQHGKRDRRNDTIRFEGGMVSIHLSGFRDGRPCCLDSRAFCIPFHQLVSEVPSLEPELKGADRSQLT